MTDNPRCFKEKNRLLPDQVNLYHMLQLSFEQKKELNVAYLGGMNSCAFVSQEATPDGVNERHCYDLSTRSNTGHWGLVVVSHNSQQNKVRWRNMQTWETCHLSTHFMWWKTLFGKEVHVVMVKRAAPVGMWAVMGHHPLPCAVSVNIYHELPPCCTNVVICAPSSLSFYGAAFTLRYRISFLGDDPYSTHWTSMSTIITMFLVYSVLFYQAYDDDACLSDITIKGLFSFFFALLCRIPMHSYSCSI